MWTVLLVFLWSGAIVRANGSYCPELDYRSTTKKQTVTFTASLDKPVTVPNHGIVKFDKVWTNIGKAYDPSTGIFTAKVTGAYHFSCTVMNAGKSSVRVHLYQNETPTVVAYTYDSDNYDTGSLNINLALKKGDKVSIRMSPRNGKVVYSERTSNMSMFSGFLIAQ